MARKPQERILHVRRVRSMPDDGSKTLHWILSYRGDLFDRLGFVGVERCPQIDGEEAWVRVHWWSKSNYPVVEQVADKQGTPLKRAG